MPKKQAYAARPMLTKTELERMTGDELMSVKLNDQEMILLQEVNGDREKERIASIERFRIEASRYYADLALANVSTRELHDSHGKSPKYPIAIPILLKHLQMPYSDAIKDSIARTLAVPLPEIRAAWPILVEEYRNAPTGMGYKLAGDTHKRPLGAKHGLAVALSVAATASTLPELIDLASDPANGESRVLLLDALRKSRSEAAKRAVEKLASDPTLSKEIAAWKANGVRKANGVTGKQMGSDTI